MIAARYDEEEAMRVRQALHETVADAVASFRRALAADLEGTLEDVRRNYRGRFETRDIALVRAWFRGATLEAAGEPYAITRERVRQVVTKQATRWKGLHDEDWRVKFLGLLARIRGLPSRPPPLFVAKEAPFHRGPNPPCVRCAQALDDAGGCRNPFCRAAASRPL